MFLRRELFSPVIPRVLILSLIFFIGPGNASQAPSEAFDEFLGATGKHLFHFVHVRLLKNNDDPAK